MKIRFFFIVSFFILLYGALSANLYRLQVVKSDYYGSRVEALNEAQEKLSLRRGDIFFTDRFGNDIPVALNKDYPAVYAVPKEIKDGETVSELLAPILAVKKESLERSLANRELLFRLLAEKVSPEVISAVKELRLPGIYTTKKQHRFYPFGELASQIIGFVGLNEEHNTPTGLYGAEKKFEADLKKGKDIHFSIDRNIQSQAEESLKNLIETYKASAGTVIIGDPNTGKILAFANAPAFDPNAYNEFPVGNFINSGIQSVYEPGSVFKPLTMAAGIDLGKITPETTFFDSGSITLNGKKITNWDGKAHGKVTMTNVIEQSINTGAVFTVRKIGREPFLEFLKKIGFGKGTGIDAPDEAIGSLKNLERKNAEEVDVATAAFGQGTAVTPIQLVGAFSAIANGGFLVRPSLNAEIKKIEKKRVMSEETAREVTAMMESAVEKAMVAALPQHWIAGKTGTAQIPDFKKGGYSDHFIHTYIGFGPVSNPAFVALIKLDKPNAALAGITVVPAFRELARFILNYYNIPPDKLEPVRPVP